VPLGHVHVGVELNCLLHSLVSFTQSFVDKYLAASAAWACGECKLQVNA
jgi:hypothetical protein